YHWGQAAHLTDRPHASLPALLIEELLRLRWIEGERPLERVVPCPHALGKRTDRYVVHAEEDPVHDRLAVDGPVHRLAHRAVIGRRAADVHAEPEGVARTRRHDEAEEIGRASCRG